MESWEFMYPTPHMFTSNMSIIKFYIIMSYQVVLTIVYYWVFFSFWSTAIGLAGFVGACINDFQLSVARFNATDTNKSFESNLKNAIRLHVNINR